MGVRVKRQASKLDGQTELYLVLSLLALALILILILVAFNCVITCCHCQKSRRRERKRFRLRKDEFDEGYCQQILSLLKRQQAVERQWEENKRVRDQYSAMSPQEAKASLSQLTSRNPSPVRSKRSRLSKSSIRSENDIQNELANYKVNHTVRIKTTSSDMSPALKRNSWLAILDGKEVKLNEEDVIGGSMVIIRRFEPMKILETSNIKKDTKQSKSVDRSRKPGIETIV